MADEDLDGTGAPEAGDQGGDSPESVAPETTPTPAAATAPAEEQFIDPSQLPEELKPHWKRMHGAYNKKLQSLNSRKSDIELVDRYRSDPDFARAFLAAEYARVYGTTPGAPPAQAQAPQGQDAPPPQLVQAIRSRLSPELQWMAESLAAATWTGQRMTTAPLQQQVMERERATKQSAYDELATRLSERAPGWEQHEEDMLDVLNFLQSPELTHSRWGSKLDVLLNLVTGNAQATTSAIRRMGEAARNRTATGLPGRTATTNVAERVMKAPHNRAAIEIAADEAIKELQRNGIAIPD